MTNIAELFDITISSSWGLDDLVYILFLYFFHIFTWTIPTFTLIIYLVFGANFFLFAWSDNLALYFITDATSRWSFIIHAFTSFYSLWSWYVGGSEADILIFIGYTILAGGLEYSAWKVGVNAARRVDPTWNEHRGLLYPPFFYSFGWVEDPPYLGGTDPKYDVKPEQEKEVS